MARTLKTSTTSWVNIGTGPAVLDIIGWKTGSVLKVNSSATDATAHSYQPGPQPNQIDWRSGEDIFIKSTEAGWSIVLDTDV